MEWKWSKRDKDVWETDADDAAKWIIFRRVVWRLQAIFFCSWWERLIKIGCVIRTLEVDMDGLSDYIWNARCLIEYEAGHNMGKWWIFNQYLSMVLFEVLITPLHCWILPKQENKQIYKTNEMWDSVIGLEHWVEVQNNSLIDALPIKYAWPSWLSK
jgi:hypothetical protein